MFFCVNSSYKPPDRHTCHSGLWGVSVNDDFGNVTPLHPRTKSVLGGISVGPPGRQLPHWPDIHE